jgi:uncharacterized protein
VIYNVAQLLKSDVGTTRQYTLDEWAPSLSEQVRMASPARGNVQLIRTNRGILVRANLTVSVELECSRCLEVYVEDLSVDFAEEYIPIVDVVTGQPTNIPHESYAFLINAKHELDVQPALREYGLLALPMKPLCRPNCAGLCPECGTNRNQQRCECLIGASDGRFGVLRALLASNDESN